MSSFAEGRVLVTGAAGFVGRYVISALREHGMTVAATGREARPGWLPASVEWHQANLLDADSVATLPRDWWAVVHLAGLTVPSLFHSPEPIVANVTMTLNLLEKVRLQRLLLVSSCHVYGSSSQTLDERSPVRPRGRYGLSKHLVEQLGFASQNRCDVRIARPFNHVGPHMPAELAIPSLLRRIAQRQDRDQPLKMMGRNSTRDFIDVRDVASAYAAILAIDSPDERAFNVCTGIPRTIEDVARIALRLADQTGEVQFEQVSGSTDDTDYLVGNPGRLKTLTAWQPRFSLESSIQMAFEESLRVP